MRSACITSKGSTEELSCRALKHTGSHLTRPGNEKVEALSVCGELWQIPSVHLLEDADF